MDLFNNLFFTFSSMVFIPPLVSIGICKLYHFGIVLSIMVPLVAHRIGNPGHEDDARRFCICDVANDDKVGRIHFYGHRCFDNGHRGNAETDFRQCLCIGIGFVNIKRCRLFCFCNSERYITGYGIEIKVSLENDVMPMVLKRGRIFIFDSSFVLGIYSLTCSCTPS